MGGRSRYELHLIREGSNDWRITLPDRIKGNNFAGMMAKDMELLAKQSDRDKWPDNRTEAYINLTAQALHALAYDTDRDRSASGRD